MSFPRFRKRCYKCSIINFSSAIAVLFPFLPMALTELGLSPSESGQIYGIIPFLSAIIRVAIGALADKLRAHKAMLMIFCVATGTIFVSLMFVPRVPRVDCDNIVEPVRAVISPCDDKREVILCLTENTEKVERQILDCTTNMRINCSGMTSCGQIRYISNSTTWNFPRPSSQCSNHSLNDHLSSCVEGLGAADIFKESTCDEKDFGIKIALNCSIVIKEKCLKERQKYDVTFWTAFAVSLLGYFAFSPTTPLMHAIAYSLLGEDRNSWGKQRYFGTMGFLTGGLTVGLAMQLTSEGENTNVTANFIAYFSLCIISSILVHFYQVPSDVQCGSLLQNLKVLVKNPALDALFVLVFCLGTVMGACETFLLLYIKELGGPELLLGLSLFVNCVMEIPVLYFANIYLRKLGYINCLYLSCAAFALRFLAYGLIHNPWLVLLINCLHSITFGMMYCTATAYGSANTPAAMHGTIQGTIQGLHFGFGRGIGGITAGLIVEKHGMRTMFFTFSGLSVVFLFLYFVVQCFLPKQTITHRHTTDEPGENTRMYDIGEENDTKTKM